MKANQHLFDQAGRVCMALASSLGRVGLLLTLLATVLPVAAQTETGEIHVNVVAAETNRAIPGVEIVAKSRDGTQYMAVSEDSGSVIFDTLEAGLYEVTATGPGLVTGVEPNIRVTARKALVLRMEMLPAYNIGQLEEVVVVARARGADPYGAVSAALLNREELRSAVGSGSDVLRALDGLPGLLSTGAFADFTVRGRGPRDNLIFVDGLPFDKVVHFDQTLGEEEDIGGGRFSIFAPNSINSAEFSPGGWSAAYGGRSGSLLDLEVVGGGPTPSASLRVDIAGLELGYEGPSGVHDGTTIFVTARHFNFGRVFELIGENDVGEPTLTDFVLKTVTEVDEFNSFEFLAILAPEEYERDIDNVLESSDFEDVALLKSEQDLGLLGLTWNRLVGESGEWTNRIYARNSDKVSSEGESFPDLVPDGTAADKIPVREDIITVGEEEKEFGWRSDYSTRNRLGGFSTGLRLNQVEVDYSTVLSDDWIRYVYRTTDPRPLGQDFIVLTPENINSEYAAKDVSYAGYAEQVFEVGDWDLRTGLRYDYEGFSDESLVSPRLAANYRYSPNLQFSATAGIFYQSPRYLVRAADPDNFDIKSERIEHVSLGFERLIGGRWSLLMEGYYQQLDDLVTAEGRTSARVNNNGTGTSYGADVVLSRSFDNDWSGNIIYSYNRARRDDNNGQGEYDADFSRTHFFSAGGAWEINERWKIAARWKYASGRPTDDFFINEDVLGPGLPLRFSKELTDQNTLRLDDYHSLNMRVDYRRPVGPVDLIAFLDVINVYGGPNQNTQEFDPRRGINVVEENSPFPLVGLIFERTW